MEVTHMVAVVESYIHHRTEKEVKINLNNINLLLLIEAYQHAIDWFQENKGRVDFI